MLTSNPSPAVVAPSRDGADVEHVLNASSNLFGPVWPCACGDVFHDPAKAAAHTRPALVAA